MSIIEWHYFISGSYCYYFVNYQVWTLFALRGLSVWVLLVIDMIHPAADVGGEGRHGGEDGHGGWLGGDSSVEDYLNYTLSVHVYSKYYPGCLGRKNVIQLYIRVSVVLS